MGVGQNVGQITELDFAKIVVAASHDQSVKLSTGRTFDGARNINDGEMQSYFNQINGSKARAEVIMNDIMIGNIAGALYTSDAFVNEEQSHSKGPQQAAPGAASHAQQFGVQKNGLPRLGPDSPDHRTAVPNHGLPITPSPIDNQINKIRDQLNKSAVSQCESDVANNINGSFRNKTGGRNCP